MQLDDVSVSLSAF